MSKQNKENTQSFMNNVTIILISQVLVKVLGMVYRIVITTLTVSVTRDWDFIM